MSDTEVTVEKESKPIIIRNTTDLQRLKLEKLMKNPDKPVIIPEKPKERGIPVVPDFVRNVMGSSAGAGSGEFHVYRHLRRKEYARQKYMKEKGEREKLDNEYHQKLEENMKKAEERTAKKRQKRLKKKQKQKKKMKKTNAKSEESKSEGTDTSSENESESGNDQQNSEDKIKEDDKQMLEDTQLTDDKNKPEKIEEKDEIHEVESKEIKLDENFSVTENKDDQQKSSTNENVNE